jgi:hypothetical protein
MQKIQEKIAVDCEDFEDMVIAIEDSFAITFQPSDFPEQGISVGDFAQLLTRKIDLPHSGDCTSQQVFYQLRRFFEREHNLSKTDFHKNMDLETLLPRKDRRKIIQKIEHQLGIKSDILTINVWLGLVLILTFFGGFYFLFKQFQMGILLFLIFRFLIKIKGNELKINTVKALTDHIAMQNYRQLRSPKNSFNPAEIPKIMDNLIEHHFGYNPAKFNAETVIKW